MYKHTKDTQRNDLEKAYCTRYCSLLCALRGVIRFYIEVGYPADLSAFDVPERPHVLSQSKRQIEVHSRALAFAVFVDLVRLRRLVCFPVAFSVTEVARFCRFPTLLVIELLLLPCPANVLV